MFRLLTRSPITTHRLSILLSSTAGAYLVSSHSPSFRNDYAVPTLNTNTGINQVQDLKPKYDGAFGGKLNYQELSIGSFVGLFTGIIIGKLSHVLWAVTFSTYLLLQWLNSRGIINFQFHKMLQLGTNTIDVQKMVFERPSFNWSFILAFAISAWNV